MIERVRSGDPDEVKASPGSARRGLLQQKETLRPLDRRRGGVSTRWAFVPPVRTPPPGDAESQGRNPESDRCLHPGPPRSGEPEAIARGVEGDVDSPRDLDPTGLPPTPPEVDAFPCDASEDAYEKVVDRTARVPSATANAYGGGLAGRGALCGLERLPGGPRP